ncbi:fluoride efflux transporter CrcB [Parasphingorhabdus sp. DH2-15]|uniref:fluoride efflux transporter CrcB n=1 Tax=Parasphingorhabdus sp. DH2-15 TaxID=3444112 RepID=UPI003F686CF7
MSAATYFGATLWVMAGGALGAAGRFHIGQIMTHWAGTSWPVATLTVNIVGGLAMGILAGWLQFADDVSPMWRLFLGIGLLGGFTTFSAFSLETANMLTEGAYWQAAAYALVSVTLSTAAIFAGLILTRQWA